MLAFLNEGLRNPCEFIRLDLRFEMFTALVVKEGKFLCV